MLIPPWTPPQGSLESCSEAPFFSSVGLYSLPHGCISFLRRLALTIPVVWIVVTLVLGSSISCPGILSRRCSVKARRRPEIQRLRHDLGLDRPLLDQYKTYVFGLLKGDLGSFVSQSATGRAIHCLARYPATIELTIAAIVVSLVLAIPAGVVGAVKRGNAGRQGDRRLQPVRRFAAEFRAGAAADSVVLDRSGLAAGFRTRRHFASDSSGTHDGRGACGNYDAHGSRVDARGDPAGLRPNRPRQGSSGKDRRSSSTRCEMDCFPS